MDVDRKKLELIDERTTQRMYAKALREKDSRLVAYQRRLNKGAVVGERPVWSEPAAGELVGRVALCRPDPDLDGHSDFYIGERKADLDGFKVFSWASPVACTFYRGRRHHEWCTDVAVIRVFSHRGGEIQDFEDEIVREDAPAEPFRKRPLIIRVPKQPAAPTTPPSSANVSDQRPVVPAGRGKSDGTVDEAASPTAPAAAPIPPSARDLVPDPRPSSDDREPRPVGDQPLTRPPQSDQPGPAWATVRVPTLLRAQLRAPREKNLAPVLATLQPDQYDLVTLHPRKSVIIEGRPGTGKTIVASHRAAYLVTAESERPSQLTGDVLLVGPTVGYSHHVSRVISRLAGDSGRVRVLSLPELLREILGTAEEPRGPIVRTWQDVDRTLGVLADRAYARLASSGPVFARVYDFLRANGTGNRPVTTDPEWASYLASLPPLSEALQYRVHTPLLAYLKWKTNRHRDLKNIDHIVVDEAQDVTALEWMLLRSLNRGRAWTILGDLNQRRMDYTYMGWDKLAADVLGKPVPVHRLTRAYRSTKPILAFANRLLPRTERAVLAFQEDGPEPVVRKVSADSLLRETASEVDRLLASYPRGTVAVITVDPKAVRNRMRTLGWAAAPGNPQVWMRARRQVTIVHPDAARGLEFDAVVVVEPSSFPKNLGREGPLYTALTRPNRELVVVHSKPLPDRLRRP